MLVQGQAFFVGQPQQQHGPDQGGAAQCFGVVQHKVGHEGGACGAQADREGGAEAAFAVGLGVELLQQVHQRVVGGVQALQHHAQLGEGVAVGALALLLPIVRWQDLLGGRGWWGAYGRGHRRRHCGVWRRAVGFADGLG